MADPARAARLAKRIATIVATALEHDIKDPRLDFVTVTDARVTADLHDATVFYTVMGRTLDTPPDYEAAAAGLEKARGQLRSKVGAGTGVGAEAAVVTVCGMRGRRASEVCSVQAWPSHHRIWGSPRGSGYQPGWTCVSAVTAKVSVGVRDHPSEGGDQHC